jgi:hypothetical protein
LLTKVYIISHKEIEVSKNKLYFSVQVGLQKLRFKESLQDDTGENIDFKNPHYCKLIVQY